MNTEAIQSSTNSTRREFLKQAASAAFVLGTYVRFAGKAWAEGGAPQGNFDPNVFLKIAADGTVTLICKHVDVGQGVTTGMATVVAEELDADWSTMRFEFAPNDAAHYNNLLFGPMMVTGGSTSMAESWLQMRQVGAAARGMLVAAAAQRWQVPAAQITVIRGVVRHDPSGRRAAFSELAAEAMVQKVPTTVALKDPKDWTLIGTRLPRLDSNMKTDGSAIFALNVRRPGMLTAVLKRPDRFGATVVSFDATAALKVPGVRHVVQVPQGVAVLAADTWSAIRGCAALQVSWDDSRAEMRSSADMLAEYRGLAATEGVVAARRGRGDSALGAAARVVEAEFHFPYLAHAPMEPLNCTLEVRDGGAELWAGTQTPSLDAVIIATTLGLKPEAVKVNTLLGGGSFGRRGSFAGGWIQEVASIAKAIDGRSPVQLVWTREDDIKGGYYRPMALHRVKAGIDGAGRLVGWKHSVVCQSIFAGSVFERILIRNGVDSSIVEGIVDTTYALPDLLVNVCQATSPVPVLAFRSVGHTHTAAVMETMIDELAHASGQDPVAYRLALLQDQPRDAAVIRLAAQKAGWGNAVPKGHGRGFAYHYSFNTRVAMVADVAVEGKTIKVQRIVAAVDCGVAINPDVVAAQIEGSVGFALSTILRNRITLKQGIVEQSNFNDYEPTRMPEMPRVEVHIVKSSAAPSGIGEPGVPPLAPAIGNALFTITGKRLRSLPFKL